MSVPERTRERYGIAVDTERCTGCGACVEVCPTGALYLVDGKAAVDNSLCRGCEACLGACPVEALSLVRQPEAGAQAPTGPSGTASRSLARQPAPEPIRVRTESPMGPWRTQVLPVVGAALAWAGREIVPRVVDAVLDTFDRTTTERQMTTTPGQGRGDVASGRGGRGRQRRRRRRGGR